MFCLRAASSMQLPFSNMSSSLPSILINNHHLIVAHFFFFLLITVVLLKWRRQHKRRDENKKPLPPGSLGWPYVGETLRLYTQNPDSFFSLRQVRYGGIFKTHILGCGSVVVSSPEAVKTVLVTKAHLFKPSYPPGKEILIGPHAVFFHQGPYHSMLKKLIRSSFVPAAIKHSISHIDQIALHLLSQANPLTNTLHLMKKYAFDVSMISILGDDSPEREVMDEIEHLYHCIEKGYNSMPLDLPATPFRKALNARRKLNEKLKGLIERRRQNKKQEDSGFGGGLLGVLLGATNEEDGDSCLSDSQITDNIIGVIFAAHDTTASVLTWILKYLHDNPDLLCSVTREQDAIQQKIVQENRRLTWDDTRNMSFTTRVIQETLRRATILSFAFREAAEDVEFEGYLIPKGWKVLPLFRSLHHSPLFFPQPHKFDPCRFLVAPKPNTYLPFGNGVHSCPGNELAKLEMLVLLHHLTTSYRWKVVGDDDGIQYGPFLVPKGGLPIQITLRNNKDKKMI